MKRMLYFLSVALVLSSFLYSCQNDGEFDPLPRQFTILHQMQSYPIHTQEGLQAYIKATIGKNDVQITESSLEEAADELGKFYLIRVKYVDGDVTTALAISLLEAEEATEKKEGSLTLAAECIMVCTPQKNGFGCDQEIIKRCQSISCSCNSGTGGAVSSISFDGNER